MYTHILVLLNKYCVLILAQWLGYVNIYLCLATYSIAQPPTHYLPIFHPLRNTKRIMTTL